jgi:hypothetical protein
MSLPQRNHLRLLLALASFCCLPLLQAANITIVNSQALSFGKFVAANGTLTVSPGGMRSVSGAIVLLQTGPGQAAQFVVTGDPDAVYSVSLPIDGIVAITNGGSSVAVNGFASNPASTGVLPLSGTQILNVGARLEVTAGLTPGAYSGTFSVVVDYN